jgi:hypothetical protein
MRSTNYEHPGFGWAAWIFVLIAVPSAWAEVIEYEEKSDWLDAVGEFTTIGFTEFPHGTWVFEQYAHLGAHFVDGADIILCCDPESFPEDGAGLNGNTEVHVVFDEPLTHIALDFPGATIIELFRGGELIYTSDEFGGSGIGNFGGLVTTDPFDEVIIHDPVDFAVFIDDIHFGPPIPAPGVLSLFALGFIGSTRRRCGISGSVDTSR